MKKWKDNMLILSVLSRLASERGESYGQFVAHMSDAELKRRVRQIRTSIRRRHGAHYLIMQERGESSDDRNA